MFARLLVNVKKTISVFPNRTVVVHTMDGPRTLRVYKESIGEVKFGESRKKYLTVNVVSHGENDAVVEVSTTRDMETLGVPAEQILAWNVLP